MSIANILWEVTHAERITFYLRTNVCCCVGDGEFLLKIGGHRVHQTFAGSATFKGFLNNHISLPNGPMDLLGGRLLVGRLSTAYLCHTKG